jgi:hypothetical protein
MIACAVTHIVLVALLVVLTAVAATQKSVTARKKKQAKDELAPVLGAFDLGISFTRGVVGVGAGITNATRVAGPNGLNGPSGSSGPLGSNGPSGPGGQSGPRGPMVPVPYTPRQIKADAGQTTFCVEGVPEAVRARLSKFVDRRRHGAGDEHARRRDVQLGRTPHHDRRDQEGFIRRIVPRRDRGDARVGLRGLHGLSGILLHD